MRVSARKFLNTTAEWLAVLFIGFASGSHLDSFGEVALWKNALEPFRNVLGTMAVE